MRRLASGNSSRSRAAAYSAWSCTSQAPRSRSTPTETLDYIVVVSGELTLVLPDEEVTLGPGDTLVQQATPHGWANHTAEPCVMAVVLLSTRRGVGV